MAIVVTFYNHKGGVSKTTTTFNVAHLAAITGLKVLAVDADPQCNLTELMISQIIQHLDDKSEKTGSIEELPGTSLLDILRPRIDGAIPFVDTKTAKTIPVTENLDIIRGDVALNSIEDSIAEAHMQRFSGKVHDKRTYVAIGDFVQRMAAERGYDLVLIDVGPSSGALTRSCFLSCDGFFIPISPDRFNVQAIGTLAIIIDRWLKEHAEVFEDFLALDLPVRRGKPKFLGTVAQHFKILKGRPKPGYKLWMDRIPTVLVDRLFPILMKHSNPELDLTSGLTRETVTVTEIPDFQSLAPLMQEFGKPVFSIAQEDTAVITESGAPWAGATWKDAQTRMKNFRDKYSTILDRLKLVV
jgi:chromosome partitioning protein